MALHEPNLVCLLSERDVHYLEGEIYFACAPLLKEGRYSAEEIAFKLQKEISLAETFFILDRLETAGYIEHVDSRTYPTGERSEAAFCNFANVDYSDACIKLKKTSVHVSKFGKVSDASFCAVLDALGIRVTQKIANADFCVVLTDNYLDEAIQDFQKRVPQKAVQMLVKPVGHELWMGPILKRGETPCFNCLLENLKRHRLEEAYLRQKQKLEATSIASLPSTVQLAYHLAATEIYKWIVSAGKSVLNARLISFDLLTMKSLEHALFSSPKCAICKKEEVCKPSTLLLSSEGKSSSNGGSWRVMSDQETWEKLHRHISPILGIVPNVRPTRRVEHPGIHVYSCGKNYARSPILQLENFALESLCTGSDGKGKTALQSRISALGEYLELYSALFQGSEHRISSSYKKLKEQAIHPHEVLLYSQKQYQEREKINAAISTHNKIPFPFCEERSVEWSQVWSLTEKRWKYLPTNCCYLGYHTRIQEPFCFDNPNGLASGSSLEEAILHGMFELIERDAVGIWWHNRIQRPAVDLTSFNDPFIDQLLKTYQKLGKKIWALDLTHDLGVPVFAALCSSLDKKEELPAVRFGAHLDPHIALTRALTELNQSPRALVATDSELYTEVLVPQGYSYFYPLLGHEKKASDYSIPQERDLLEGISICQKRIEKLGMEVLILDVSRPEVALKVVKVMVPGLRHFSQRYAPGRLFDIPVKLGWLSKPLEEETLNPLEFSNAPISSPHQSFLKRSNSSRDLS